MDVEFVPGNGICSLFIEKGYSIKFEIDCALEQLKDEWFEKENGRRIGQFNLFVLRAISESGQFKGH